MAVEIDARTATRIAELLDLFAELPSTPPVLTSEAREHATRLLDLVNADPDAPSHGHRPYRPSQR
jgi:hypothetical protein